MSRNPLFSVLSVPSVSKSFFVRSLAEATAAAILSATLLIPIAHAQDKTPPMTMPMNQQMPHHHGDVPLIAAQYPRMGRAQEKAGAQLVTLEQLEKMATETNPTLRQAETEIRAAKARTEQAGLYPNPSVGYTGDEIRGGSVGGGKQGFFVQQTIVTAGKLARSRDIFSKEMQLAEIEAQEQKIRVETSVKTAFLRVLAAQELLDVRRDLAKIQQDFSETQHQLSNTGQADESEVLDAEVDAQRLRLSARMQENTLREEWRSLTALLGRPDLPLSTVSGDLEHNWPD